VRIWFGVGSQHGDAVDALPSRRVADRALAAQAGHEIDRLHAALFQSVPEAGLDNGQVLGRLAQQRRGHHGHIRPCQQHLTDTALLSAEGWIRWAFLSWA
jgi:hypothetical protein